MLARAFALLILSACVTSGASPVGNAITGYCAPPVVTARYADPDGLPALYDEALLAAVGPPRVGAAVRFVEAGLADGLTVDLAEAYTGDAACRLDVAVENAVLPDRTRFTPLSGQKSFLVRAVLTAPDGSILAETVRPFTVLAEHQGRGRLGGSAWRRIGNTQDLRAEAIALLTDASIVAIADAMGGRRTQTGLSGRLVAHTGRVPNS